MLLLRDAPACPESFEHLDLGLMSERNIPEPLCECECGPVQGGECSGPAQLERTSDESCLLFASAEPVATSCTQLGNAIGSGDHLIATTEATDGSCSPSGNSSILPPSLDESLTLCHYPSATTCSDGLCLPLVPDGQYCIWQTGEHECPTDTNYFDEVLGFSGFKDGRACDSCSCGPPADYCSGRVDLFESSDCSGAAATTPAEIDECVDASSPANSARYVVSTDTEASCNPSGGTVQGDISWLGATTFCCSSRF